MSISNSKSQLGHVTPFEESSVCILIGIRVLHSGQFRPGFLEIDIEGVALFSTLTGFLAENSD
ncbi:hypothetical protein GCM10026987_22790 [Belliella aquatica]|uniref:Uncharacterized protein n=1 Tax=Belliella aquatica TaxID=1323734 RepID=A0ABQ1MK58_9BACT|nr:hypothetical protein GCM10010993_20720 [Belliella aquatica]